MSSGKTHMLIGGVCGLGLTRLVNMQDLALPGAPDNPYLLPAVLVAASSVLATLPDIDEPSSWIAQRIHFMIIVATGIFSGLLGWSAALAGRVDWSPWIAAFVAGCVGLVAAGPLVSLLVLRLIRLGVGGHRRLTHSLIVAVALAVIAGMLLRNGYMPGAMVPAALAYAIVIHVIGDVVTPQGVPLWYPLSKRSVGLPRPLSAFGEPLILVAALGVGVLLIRGW